MFLFIGFIILNLMFSVGNLIVFAEEISSERIEQNNEWIKGLENKKELPMINQYSSDLKRGVIGFHLVFDRSSLKTKQDGIFEELYDLIDENKEWEKAIQVKKTPVNKIHIVFGMVDVSQWMCGGMLKFELNK